MQEPLISIIVPHYNSIEGIIRLIESIPKDDRLELVVVDDRSTVDTHELEITLKKRGSSLNINNRIGKGAGTARNIGVEISTGRWLLFADADDYFTENWLSIVLEYIDTDYDEVYFAPTSFNCNTQDIGARHKHYEELVKNHKNRRTKKTETELKYGFYTPWSKLIRRTVFTENSIVFDEQPVANDVMAMNLCAFYSKKIASDDRTIYCVTCGEKTLTSKKNEKNFDIRIDTKIRRYNFLRKSLNKREFRWTHSDYYMAGSLADAVLGKWGIKKLKEVLEKYHRNDINYLTIYMFEPSFLFRYIWMDLKWRKEMGGK